MTSDETKIQKPNLFRLANVTCKTRDKGQQEKSRISCRCRDIIRKLRTDKNCSQKIHGQTIVKMSSIPDLKRLTAPKILDSLNTMMQRTASKNAAGLRRICKRSDQRKLLQTGLFLVRKKLRVFLFNFPVAFAVNSN